MVEMNPLERLWVNSVNERYVPSLWRGLFTEAELQEELRWLEVGAGKGYVTAEAVDAFDVEEAVVSDYDPGQVAAARRYLGGNLGNHEVSPEFASVDVLELPFEDSSFDVVAASLVLHFVEPRRLRGFEHVPDAIEEVDRVLDDDGCFLSLNFTRNTRVRRTLRNQGFRVEYQQRHLPFLESYCYRKTG